MKRPLFAALLFVLALPALAATSVLSPDGTRYSIAPAGEIRNVELIRVAGDERDVLVVPGTDDEAFETQAQLAYDGASGSVYVIWSRQADDANEIRVAELKANGVWSDVVVVDRGDARRLGTQVAVTRDGEASLLHLAWWNVSDETVDPRYAFVVFENDEFDVSEVGDLRELAGVGGHGAAEREDTGEAVHPPLAMARATDGVDVAFGDKNTTALTLVRVGRQVGELVRIRKPLGRDGMMTPKANVVSGDSDPVQALIIKGRVVLYAPGDHFRFVVFENGEWSPVRALKVDENTTTEELVRDLRRTLEDIETVVNAGDSSK